MWDEKKWTCSCWDMSCSCTKPCWTWLCWCCQSSDWWNWATYGTWDVQTSLEQPERSPKDVKMINDIFGDMDTETWEDIWWQDDLTDDQVARLQSIFKKS